MADDLQTLPAKDELRIYNIDVPNIPKDIIFPDEVNRYLRDKIQFLTHENGMLQKNLSEKSMNLEKSKMQIKNLDAKLKKQQSGSFISALEVANSKIVDFSKKLREKTSEMEALKTKCSKLEKRLVATEYHEKTLEMYKDQTEKEQVSISEQEAVIKSLQDRVTTVSSKLFETRNLNAQLKNDIKATNKLLQQEVGQSVEVVKNSSNWRGRAQIICDLQEKNNELREKLRMYQGSTGSQLSRQIETPVPTKNEKKIENLTQECDALTQELQETKKKLDASRSRAKCLDTEIVVLKTKLKTAIEQTERDNDRLIILTGKVAQLQNTPSEGVKSLQKQLSKADATIKSLKVDLAKEQCIIENLQRELDKKDNDIKKQAALQSKPTNAIYDAAKANEKELLRLEAERLRLLDLVNLGTKRLEEERTAHHNAQLQYLRERQKGAKLESKVARLRLEQNFDKGSSYSAHSIKSSSRSKDEALMDRLELAEEQIKVLTARLQMEKRERLTDFDEFKKMLLDNRNAIEND